MYFKLISFNDRDRFSTDDTANTVLFTNLLLLNCLYMASSKKDVLLRTFIRLCIKYSDHNLNKWQLAYLLQVYMYLVVSTLFLA